MRYCLVLLLIATTCAVQAQKQAQHRFRPRIDKFRWSVSGQCEVLGTLLRSIIAHRFPFIRPYRCRDCGSEVGFRSRPRTFTER
jgi:hypothetical protein